MIDENATATDHDMAGVRGQPEHLLHVEFEKGRFELDRVLQQLAIRRLLREAQIAQSQAGYEIRLVEAGFLRPKHIFRGHKIESSALLPVRAGFFSGSVCFMAG